MRERERERERARASVNGRESKKEAENELVCSTILKFLGNKKAN